MHKLACLPVKTCGKFRLQMTMSASGSNSLKCGRSFSASRTTGMSLLVATIIERRESTKLAHSKDEKSQQAECEAGRRMSKTPHVPHAALGATYVGECSRHDTAYTPRVGPTGSSPQDEIRRINQRVQKGSQGLVEYSRRNGP